MAEPKQQIFRKKSLERLSTPDRLDQLLRVVKRRAWLPLLALGGLLVLAVVWSFLGRVPVTADATAILVHPRSVVPIQATASGEILTLDVRVGDTVEKDDPIATLNRPDLDEEIDLQEERLKQFELRAKTLQGFSVESAQQEQALIDAQCELLGKRIEKIQQRADRVSIESAAYNVKQRERLEDTRDLFEELDKAMKGRYESYETLLRQKDTSEDTALLAKQRWYTNRLGLADIEVKLQELELREIQSLEVYERQMDLIADLEIQRAQLELRRHEVSKALEEARIQRTTSAEEIQLTIDRLESLRSNQGQILSDNDGTVLEVTVSQGSMVTTGQRIATMAKKDPGEALRALAYFGIADGKKIRDGMEARVSPVTVQQQRHGSIVASVLDHSPFPVTADSVVNQVGNREMAQMLVGQESRIEVTLALDPALDGAPGFRWTSAGGPGFAVTAGTTARVRVTLEERAPITLLIPALRGWLGLD